MVTTTSVTSACSSMFPIIQKIYYIYCSVRTWLLVYLYNVSAGGYLALTVYFPVYYKDAHNQSTEVAGYIGGLFPMICASFRMVAGCLSDRIHFMNGGVFMESISLLEVIVGSLIMIFFEDFWINIVGTIVIALGIGGGDASTYKILPEFSKVSVAGEETVKLEIT